ncbi:MAG TPA: STAS domain-containing protein [Candidatus Limnocylindria bacterium]|nr:STAS domain-containing protein [Candidatus Limnocylindria bacterium]
MGLATRTRIPEILREHRDELINEWTTDLAADRSQRPDLITPQETRQQASEFVSLLADALERTGPSDRMNGAWVPVRQHLESITRSRVQQGFTPSAVASFVLSFKRPLFEKLRSRVGADELANELWSATLLLDDLGLWTTEIYQKSREEIISRQQQEMLELSTPVVKLWDGILGLPMIGTLDSARTQVVMETLLQRIVETGSQIAIIDITGVPTVDTLVAQHLLKTVAAAHLMGTEVIISGVRPQIAQTIVHLGVDLGQVITKASLADAFALALQRSGLTVVSRDQKART